MIRWVARLVLGTVLVASTPTHAGTIVFDFEDGLQGWELFGAVQRVQTQLLGGEWAIFGDGLIPGTSAFMELSRESILQLPPLVLGGRTSITFDVHVIATDGLAEPEARIAGLEIIEVVFVGLVQVRWNFPGSLHVGPDGEVIEGPPTEGGVVAFIDNITLHTIPEPSVLLLLALGGTAALAVRRSRNRA